MEKSASVALTMHFDGHLLPAAVISLLQLVYRSTLKGVLSTVILGEGGIIDEARNRIVAESLGSDDPVTHLMWTDPGSVIPSDAIERLVAREKDVVGGVSPRRLDQAAAPAYDLGPFRWREGPFDELQRVGGVGLGCTLVKSSVYRRVQTRHQDERWHRRFYGRSEDVFFFERCRELGVEVWLDPSVRTTMATVEPPRTASTTIGQLMPEGPSQRTVEVGAAATSEPGIALAVPFFEPVSPLAVANLVAVVRQATEKGLLRGLFFTDGMFYDTARNQIVNDVLASDEAITHIFWLDSDMVVPLDALERLLAASRPVTGGLYHNKRDLTPAAFELDPLRLALPSLEGPVRVGGFGLGCALIRRSVYDGMEARFGDRRWHQIGENAGEEVFFFQRCNEMGIETWLDTSVRCGHVRDQVVTTADWEAICIAPGSGRP